MSRNPFEKLLFASQISSSDANIWQSDGGQMTLVNVSHMLG